MLTKFLAIHPLPILLTLPSKPISAGLKSLFMNLKTQFKKMVQIFSEDLCDLIGCANVDKLILQYLNWS
jgi:hypothetical protein